jgi:hypothetical protein
MNPLETWFWLGIFTVAICSLADTLWQWWESQR